MNRVPVYSTNVKSAGYDEKLKVLEVEFHNGYIYQYSKVPPKMYEDFISSPSKGTFVNKIIRNKYPTTRLNK